MTTTLILAAGQGLRFSRAGFKTPKPLLVVNGKTLIEHTIDSLAGLGDTNLVATRVFNDPSYNDSLSKIILQNNLKEINLGEKHNGPSDTAKQCYSYFQKNKLLDSPLIIINCDQVIDWFPANFLDFIKKNDPDGAVLIHKSTDPRNSFAKIIKNKIVELVEKEAISDDALVGFHYWKTAKDFFNSALELSQAQIDLNSEEYVSETYNFLIKKNKKILPYYCLNNEYIPLGIPEDLDNYSGKTEWRQLNL
jgi:NDP-sugar pyrophosphorylase family protein